MGMSERVPPTPPSLQDFKVANAKEAFQKFEGAAKKLMAATKKIEGNTKREKSKRA